MVSSGVEMKTLPVKHKAQTLRTPTAHGHAVRPRRSAEVAPISARLRGTQGGGGVFLPRVPVSTRSISFTHTEAHAFIAHKVL